MNKTSLRDELQRLTRHVRLHELMEQYPAVWEEAGRELISALEGGHAQKLNEFAVKAASTAKTWENRIRKSRNNEKVIESALPHLIKSRMSLLALDKCYLAAATGRSSGRRRSLATGRSCC